MGNPAIKSVSLREDPHTHTYTHTTLVSGYKMKPSFPAEIDPFQTQTRLNLELK